MTTRVASLSTKKLSYQPNKITVFCQGWQNFLNLNTSQNMEKTQIYKIIKTTTSHNSTHSIKLGLM